VAEAVVWDRREGRVEKRVWAGVGRALLPWSLYVVLTLADWAEHSWPRVSGEPLQVDLSHGFWRGEEAERPASVFTAPGAQPR
jgi:hypothetical protein